MNRGYFRRYPRIPVRLPVVYTAGDESFHCFAASLGGGGLFLADVEGLEAGKEISVRFRPAKHLPSIQTKASIRYVIHGKGTAIEFAEISEQDRARVLRLIHQKIGDRRLHPRAPLATQLECDGCMTLAFSRNIGMDGMFIETTVPLPVGASLTVRFNLAQMDVVVTASAQVIYRVEKMGMGVYFAEMEPQDRDAIRAYLDSAPDAPASESVPGKPV